MRALWFSSEHYTYHADASRKFWCVETPILLEAGPCAWRSDTEIVAWDYKPAGGEGRNRTSFVFHKPLEINRLLYSLLFDYKRVTFIVNTYPAISFFIGFSPFKTVRAGTFAGRDMRSLEQLFVMDTS
jgi:hypothetical protein